MNAGEIVARASLALPGGDLAPIVVLAAAFCEGLVVIGLFVPLTPLLVALGVGIAAGPLSPTLLGWAIVGAALGNLVSFALGRGVRSRKLSLPGLPTRAVARAEHLLQQHEAIAVVLARFLGAPATITPFFVGWSNLSWRRFLAANLVASTTWLPRHGHDRLRRRMRMAVDAAGVRASVGVTYRRRCGSAPAIWEMSASNRRLAWRASVVCLAGSTATPWASHLACSSRRPLSYIGHSARGPRPGGR